MDVFVLGTHAQQEETEVTDNGVRPTLLLVDDSEEFL